MTSDETAPEGDAKQRNIIVAEVRGVRADCLPCVRLGRGEFQPSLTYSKQQTEASA